jgi:hypothetical protein
MPKVLEITARRAAPAEQEATLIYERGAGQPVRPPSDLRTPAGGLPAINRP